MRSCNSRPVESNAAARFYGETARRSSTVNGPGRSVDGETGQAVAVVAATVVANQQRVTATVVANQQTVAATVVANQKRVKERAVP